MTRRDWIIAVPVLTALLGCVAAFMHGVQIENAFDGIVALRAVETPAGGRVALVAAQALHVLDSQGKRLARQDLRAMGLQDSPNDMDLTVDEEGRMEAWFFEDVDPQPRVLRCAWSEDRKAMDRCSAAATGPQLKWAAQSRAVHLAVDRAGERIFVADAKSARVQIFDFAGKRVAVSEPSTLALNFPNRLRYLGQDQIAVADNDNQRLVWAEVRPGSAPRLVSTLYAADHQQARSSRKKVTDAAFGQSGAIWMLAVKQGQKSGDVLVFDGSRRPVKRAELPEGADPLFVDALGDTAIIGDYSLLMLYQIDRTGRYLGEFGDAALQAELAPMRAMSSQSKLWTDGGMIAGAIIIVAGLFLAWRFGSKPLPAIRKHAAAAAAASSDTPLVFPVVLDVTAEYRAGTRKQVWALGAAIVISMGAMIAIAITHPGGPKFASLVAQVALMTLFAAVVAWYMVRELCQPAQLRITASRAGLFRGGRVIIEVPLAAVYMSDRMLLLGKTRIVHGRADAREKSAFKYDQELLARALIRRLPVEHLIDDMALNKKLMEQQPVWLKALVVAGIAAMLVWMLKEVFGAL